MRQTALMDFLRDFRRPEPGEETGGWQPTSEQVLGADTLAIAGTMPAVSAAPPVQAVAVPPVAAAPAVPVAVSPSVVAPAPAPPTAPLTPPPGRPAGFGPPRRPGSVPPGAVGHVPPRPLEEFEPAPPEPAPYASEPQFAPPAPHLQPDQYAPPPPYAAPGQYSAPAPYAAPERYAPPAPSRPPVSPLPPAPAAPGPAVGWAPPAAWQVPVDLPPPPGVRPPAHAMAWGRPGRRPGRGRVIAAVVAAVGLVAGAGAVLLRPSGPTYPKAWDPRVAPIAAFVQSDRGLTWKHPVQVEFLAPAAFVKAIGGGGGAASDAAGQDSLETARALGLISGSPDLGAAGQRLLDNSVVGLYVPRARTVYVRGASLTPFVRVTLAHELTHALQDEYFPLARMKGGPTDDESATTALIEGDAVRVQDDYTRSLPAAQRDAYATEAQAGYSSATKANNADSVPAFLSDSASFPYDFGPTFVESLVQQGGNSLVDSAFRRPPSLDGQIVDPSSFQIGLPVPKVTLALPPAGAHVIQPPGGFGEVPLVQTLGYEVGFADAWSAVQGWTADRFDAYRLDGRVCADLAVLDDNVADAGRLATTARRWAAALPGARVSQSGATVEMSSCDPGVKWRPRSSADPYPALAARSFWIGEFEQAGHLSGVTSSCVVDDLLGQVGPGALTAAAGADSVSDPAVAAILAHERADVGACS